MFYFFLALLVIGVLIGRIWESRRLGAFGWPDFEPHPVGVLFVVVSIFGLFACASMKFGQWLGVV
jgi:hypothetical protein